MQFFRFEIFMNYVWSEVIIVKVPSFFPPFTYRLTFSQCRVFCRAEQFVNLIYGPFFFFNLFHTNYIFQSKKDMQSTNLSEFAAPKLLRFRWKLEKISSNPHEIPKKLSVYNVTERYHDISDAFGSVSCIHCCIEFWPIAVSLLTSGKKWDRTPGVLHSGG